MDRHCAPPTIRTCQRADRRQAAHARRRCGGSTARAALLHSLHASARGKPPRPTREVFPHVGVAVLAQALVVKSVAAPGSGDRGPGSWVRGNVPAGQPSWRGGAQPWCHDRRGRAAAAAADAAAAAPLRSAAGQRSWAAARRDVPVGIAAVGQASVQAWLRGTHTCVICRLSWLPRRMVIRCGYRTLSATSSVTVSTAAATAAAAALKRTAPRRGSAHLPRSHAHGHAHAHAHARDCRAQCGPR